MGVNDEKLKVQFEVDLEQLKKLHRSKSRLKTTYLSDEQNT